MLNKKINLCLLVGMLLILVVGITSVTAINVDANTTDTCTVNTIQNTTSTTVDSNLKENNVNNVIKSNITNKNSEVTQKQEKQNVTTTEKIVSDDLSTQIGESVVEKSNATVSVEQVSNYPGTNIQLKANVTDINGTPLNSGVMVFKLNDNTLKYDNGTSIICHVINGTATLNYTISLNATAKDYKLTAVFSDVNYERTENNSILTIIRSPTNITTNPVTIEVGEQFINVSATITNALTQLPAIGGKVTVKINGFTIANNLTIDSNGQFNSSLLINVYCPVGTNKLEIFYNGGKNTEETKISTVLNVLKQNATMIFTIEPQLSYTETYYLLVVNLTDNQGNKLNTGEVIFKINGKTMMSEDTPGEMVRVPVRNGVAMNYIGSDYYAKNYTITAKYIEYYTYTAEKNSTLVVERAPTNITTTPVTATQNQSFNITAQIINNETKVPASGGKVGIKIDGKTLINNLTIDGNGQFIYTVTNNTYSIGTHNVTIMYNGGRKTTETRINSTLIVKV
ncbi:MAG: Ig-like domain-containing protein [Methanobacteriaceae archaeon]|nr:Ig-like domain-containing protein [Methanobacteriaceae archaeon]